MTANPKVVEAVTTALIERLDDAGYIHHDGGGDYRVDVAVNLPQLVADMVTIGQTPVDRVLGAWQRSRRALVMPDREDLARELFIADNWRQSRDDSIADWATIVPTYRDGTYRLADAAIAAFRTANS